MPLPPDYDNRVYAGWLGKCIGVRFGAPLENWTYEEICDNLGELTGYLREDNGKLFKPDDDTAVPMLLVRALEQYREDVTPQQIGDTLLNLIGDQHGTFWWGGYGISTEHTAYNNLAAGIEAPRSGSIAQNGTALAEQIGGQIFSDIFGLVLPNNPSRAANLAEKFSRVTHDGAAVEGGRFIAALVSAAFSERDPATLIATALRQLQPGGEYARVVMAMAAFHKQNPRDWRAAFAHLKANFGYDRYPGIVHVIPNAGVVVLALLYGAGDFTRSIRIANMCGWDTDCNVGNVGAVMGTAVGVEGIEEYWRAPINDLLIASGIIGTRNILTIPQCADLFCAIGRKLHGEPSEVHPRYHFSYPGSTSNFSADGEKGRPIHWQQVELDGTKALRVAVRKLTKKGEMRAFTRTYYRPSELSSNYYEACFTPLIYPGQMVTMRLFLPEDAPDTLLGALYVHDLNGKQKHQAEGTPLVPGQWHNLTYEIPPMSDVCLSEVGVVLRNLGEEWTTGSFLIERLDWNGAAHYSTTFTKERHEAGGVSQWTRLRGYWRLEDGAYHGSGVGECETYTGEPNWQNLTLVVELTPVSGNHHLILGRVQGGLYSYAFGLAPDNSLAIYKKDKTYHLLAQVPFDWTHGKSYYLQLSVSGKGLEGFAACKGQEQTIKVRDTAAPYSTGQVGLATWDGHTIFHNVHVEAIVW